MNCILLKRQVIAIQLKTAIIGVLWLFAIEGAAQKVKSSSKKEDGISSYESYKQSSVKPGDLLAEAEALRKEDVSGALNKVEEALAIAIARKDVFNEGRSYLMLGEINASIMEWKLALGNFNSAYERLSLNYAQSVQYQGAIIGLSKSHLELGDLDLALTFANQALATKLSRSSKNDLQLHLSEIYYRMKRYSEALQALDDIAPSKVADPTMESLIENQRAKIYTQQKDYSRAQSSYDNSLNVKGAKAMPETEKSFQRNKEEIAQVLREEKRYDDEIALRNQSIDYNILNSNFSEVTKDKVELSKTLEAKGEDFAALKEAEEAVSIAEKLDDPVEQARAFLTLAELYNKRGRSGDAIQAYKRYSDAVIEKDKLADSLITARETIIKKQNDIEAVTKKVSIAEREFSLSQEELFRQQLIIYGLLLIILIIVITSWFIYKGAVASKTANQLLALKSLRSQMNPHFIFNALNSVNHFIAQQDERTANKFLSEFSLLMRLVLENSQEDFIPLQKEQEILALYMKLEHYRFRDKFEYSIQMDPEINVESIEIPPMLIQPYIENAVWHGLRYKETPGHLNLSFKKSGNNVVVEIADDGIGREKSAALKTPNQKKHSSTGLKNIRERLAILNRVYKANYRVVIDDLVEGQGTRVQIFLPVTT